MITSSASKIWGKGRPRTTIRRPPFWATAACRGPEGQSVQVAGVVAPRLRSLRVEGAVGFLAPLPVGRLRPRMMSEFSSTTRDRRHRRRGRLTLGPCIELGFGRESGGLWLPGRLGPVKPGHGRRGVLALVRRRSRFGARPLGCRTGRRTRASPCGLGTRSPAEAKWVSEWTAVPTAWGFAGIAVSTMIAVHRAWAWLAGRQVPLHI